MGSMSVAYRSWEVPTAPTVAFKEATKGRHAQQDCVIRGLSALSLYMQSQAESEPCVIDNTNVDTLSQENLESSSDGSPQSGYMTWPDRSNLVALPSQDVYAERRLEKSSGQLPLSFPPLEYDMDDSRLMRFQNGSDTFTGNYQHLPALDVVSEDRPWETFQADSEAIESVCVSSCSSTSDNSPCTSGDVSEALSGESDAQSPYKGPLDCMSSLEATLPVRKGLSRFFSGKSRSFSCLADVVSLKDLAKPENPYARKRKNVAALSGSLEPRLSPFRNGAGIKKPPHNNKSTLALAVAMSTREAMLDELECQIPIVASIVASTKWQSDSAPPRAFSCSDFQRTGCRLSPGC